MKRLFAVLLACCFLILPCPVLAAAPAPGLTVPLTPDPRTGHYKITVSDTETITGSSVTRSVERTGITAKTDVFVEYPLDVEHPGTYYVTVTALPEAGRIGLEAPFSKTVPVVTGCCPGVEGAFILGSGSAADPYQVYAPAQLKHVNAHLDAHFIQERDLTLSGTWTPLGALTGVYDGGGHFISGLRADAGGLVSMVTGAQAQVKNLTLLNPVLGGSPFGRLCNEGAKISDCTVSNAAITVSGGDQAIAGGIASITARGRIERCVVTGTITVDNATGYWAGGITGYNVDSTYIDCRTSVEVSSPLSGYRGGIVGIQEFGTSPLVLQNCHWTNPVHAVGRPSGNGGDFTPNTGESFGNSQVSSIDGL